MGNRVLRRRAEAQHVEHLPAPHFAPPEPAEETLRGRHLVGDGLQTVSLLRDGDVSAEYQHLEAHVGGKEVLDLEWAAVRCADEYLWEHALADDKARSGGLVRRVNDNGGRVMDAGPANEPIVLLQRAVGGTSARASGQEQNMVAYPMNCSWETPSW